MALPETEQLTRMIVGAALSSAISTIAEPGVSDHCRKVIPAHGRVLLVEFTVSAANQSSLGKDADMIMMAFPGGMERTEQEYQTLFERSGFRLSKMTTTKSAVSVVEGKPA